MNIGLLPLLRDDPLAFVLLVTGLIFAIALHEYAHALAADLQGDRMPRAMGRLTLNPAHHLDPVGTVLLVIAGFGWGKPVEFRPSALSSRRFGGAIVALAGPAMNALLAVVSAFLLVALFRSELRNLLVFGSSSGSQAAGGIAGILADFLLSFMSINVLLAVFNLLPLPPLDGSRLLTIFLPPSRQHIVYYLDRYGFLILLALVFFGGIRFLYPVIGWMQETVLHLAGY